MHAFNTYPSTLRPPKHHPPPFRARPVSAYKRPSPSHPPLHRRTTTRARQLCQHVSPYCHLSIRYCLTVALFASPSRGTVIANNNHRHNGIKRPRCVPLYPSDGATFLIFFVFYSLLFHRFRFVTQHYNPHVMRLYVPAVRRKCTRTDRPTAVVCRLCSLCSDTTPAPGLRTVRVRRKAANVTR